MSRHFLSFSLFPALFFFPKIASFYPFLSLFFLRRFDKSFLFSSSVLLTFSVIIWGGVTTIWSQDPMASFSLFLRLFCLCCAGVVSLSLPLSKKPLMMGALVAIFFLFLDYSAGHPWPNFLQKSTAQVFVPLGLTLSLLAFPLGKPWLLLAIFPSLFFVDCDTTWVALACGCVGFILFYFKASFFKKLFQFFFPLLILAHPFALDHLDQEIINKISRVLHVESYIHRLYIYKETSEKIKKNPFWGYGLDTSRTLGSEIKPMRLSPSVTVYSKIIPTHPHNAPLQWWLELGLMGVLLVCLCYIRILRTCPTDSPWHAGLWGGFFCVVQIVGFVNLGVWQNWWIAIVFIGCGLLTSQNTQQGPSSKVKTC